MIAPDTTWEISEGSALQRITRSRPSQGDGWALPDKHERNILKASPSDYLVYAICCLVRGSRTVRNTVRTTME